MNQQFPDWIFIPLAIVGSIGGMFLIAWARGQFSNKRRP